MSEKDDCAALLPADPSASPSSTEALPTDWRIVRLEALAALYRLDSVDASLGSFRQSEALAYTVALEHAAHALRNLTDAKQANGDTYRRILASWQEQDACLQKINAICWTDNEPMNERDATANIIRHIRDLQRRVKLIGSGNQATREQAATTRRSAALENSLSSDGKGTP